MKTDEGNKLIAEFMGGVFETEEQPIPYWENIYGGGPYPKTEDLLYHASWEWLMPVVEKIENSTDTTFDIENDNVHISGDFKLSVFEHTKLESVYTAVIRFIQWYNEQK